MDLNDSFPKIICIQCAEKLIEFHRFRSKILESHKQLSSLKTESVDECGANNEITFVDVKEEPSESNGVVLQKKSIQYSTDNLHGPSDGRRRSKKAKIEQKSLARRPAKKPEGSRPEQNANTDGKKKYICDKCGDVLLYPSRFLAHYRRSHLKQFERKTCPYCPRAFTLSTTGRFDMLLRICSSESEYIIQEFLLTQEHQTLAATFVPLITIKCKPKINIHPSNAANARVFSTVPSRSTNIRKFTMCIIANERMAIIYFAMIVTLIWSRLIISICT